MISARHAFIVYKLVAKLFGATTVEVPDRELCPRSRGHGCGHDAADRG